MSKKTKKYCKHSMISTKQYQSWCCMKSRCNNKKRKNYGGRGIRYHPDFETFTGWWKYVKPMWDKAVRDNNNDRLSIDRIDNDGDYTYGNIQIITISENSKKRISDCGNPTKGKFGKLHHNSKSVEGSKCGKIWKQFENARDAQRKTGASPHHISTICNKIPDKNGFIRKTAAGYMWRFHKLPENARKQLDI